ncbi:membrane protein insertase YidC [Laceyella putida]|uniref:Membrane protein insertase YidC n=1 Tax=Laceyella putida TaxID=110101 RepID=A0ABW2RL20_9BACL
MGKSSVFTFIQRYSNVLIAVAVLLLLSGCQPAAQPTDADASGWFTQIFVSPFSHLIKFFASLFDGNYGLSIILMTILVRLALMPMMMKQYRNQLVMKEKMNVIQPELKKIQEKYKNKQKDPEAQKRMQQEMMQLYQKHEFNPMAIGCLPMLIQLPILMGFYYAIKNSPEITTHSFLWFNLGQTDMIMPLVAAFVYYVQFKVSQVGIDPQQQKQMALLGYMSPLMIGLFSFNAPAALPLYWSVGGLFLIFQTLISKRLYKQNEALPSISK